MGIAFCLYSISSIQRLVLQTFLRNYSNTWNVVDEVTYIATLTLLGARYVLLPRMSEGRTTPRTAYAELAPQMNERLKA